ILNGIETFVTRGDLATRTATMTLEEIPSDKRRTERKLYAEFEAARPRILGALLDAVSNGLRHLSAVEAREGERPRMANASEWIEACETGALWGKDKSGRAITFCEALAADSEETALAVLGTNRLAEEVRKFVEVLKEGGEWRGTVGGLYTQLNAQIGDDERKA